MAARKRVPQVSARNSTRDFLQKFAAQVQDAARNRGDTRTRVITVDDEGVLKRFRVRPRTFGSFDKAEVTEL